MLDPTDLPSADTAFRQAFAPDWHWLRDRSDSPWYPTIRLFRQKQVGDWQTVVCEVAETPSKRGDPKNLSVPKD